MKRDSLVTTEEKLLFDILQEIKDFRQELKGIRQEIRGIKQPIKLQEQLLKPQPQEDLRPMAKGAKHNAERKG